MPSAEHEQLVQTLIETGGGRSPEQIPSGAELVLFRQGEAAHPVALPKDATVEEIRLGGLRTLRVVADGVRPQRTILYFHGGGYLFLSPEFVLGTLVGISRACEAACVAPSYRLGPERPYPAAVEDAVAAYAALLETGVAPGDIVLAGDSAGGGLAIATLLASNERGLPPPTGATVFSPWTDLAITGASVDTVNDPNVSGLSLRAMAAAYLADADPKTPLASPLYADPKALAQLPPVLIQVGGREALLDDSRRFAAAANAAGAKVTLKVLPGVIHMWMVFAPGLPESVESFQTAAAFIQDIETT